MDRVDVIEIEVLIVGGKALYAGPQIRLTMQAPMCSCY
jgi:hypothetical protein